MFIKTAVFLALISCCTAATSDVSNLKQNLLAGNITEIHDITDAALANVRGIIKSAGLDRLPLPELLIVFSEIIVGVNFTGEIGLYNGMLRGIEALHRTGAANIIFETNGDILVEAELGVYDIALDYSLVLQFFGVGPRAHVTGELSKLSVDLGLRITADAKIRVEKLIVTDSGFLRVGVTGLGIILNFVADLAANILGNLAKSVVVEVIQGPVLDIINAVIERLFPIPDGEIVYGLENVREYKVQEQPTFYVKL